STRPHRLRGHRTRQPWKGYRGLPARARQCTLSTSTLDESSEAASEYDNKAIEIREALEQTAQSNEAEQRSRRQSQHSRQSHHSSHSDLYSDESSDEECVQVQLRQIALPTFDDSVSQWLSFW